MTLTTGTFDQVSHVTLLFEMLQTAEEEDEDKEVEDEDVASRMLAKTLRNLVSEIKEKSSVQKDGDKGQSTKQPGVVQQGEGRGGGEQRLPG